MKKVSICIPVVREEKVKDCIAAIEKNAGIPRDNYEIVTDVDVDLIGCPRMLAKLVKRAQYDLICFLGDDTVPGPDFLQTALDEMAMLPEGWGVVGLNSGGNDHAHFLADRRILEHIDGGEFFPLDYLHCFGDDELKDIALEHGRWAYAENAYIKHNHPAFKAAEYDEYYQRAYDDGAWEHDFKTYRKRKIARNRRRYDVKLGLCYPLTDIWNYTHFTFSNLNIVLNYMAQKYREGMPANIDIIMPNYPGQIDAVRNDLVTQALAAGCTHILMMDTDQIYQDIDTIDRLIGHDVDVVGAIVHRRYPPYDPIVFRGKVGKLEAVSDKEIEENELVEVYATGCGCILYRSEVFLDIDYPWFELKTGEFGQVVGEDIGFCEKLQDAGHKIFVDTTIDIKHLTTMAADWSIYKLFQKLHLGANGAKHLESEVKKNG